MRTVVYGLQQKLGVFDVVAAATAYTSLHRSGKIIATADDVKFDQDKVRGPKVMWPRTYTYII